MTVSRKAAKAQRQDQSPEHAKSSAPDAYGQIRVFALSHPYRMDSVPGWGYHCGEIGTTRSRVNFFLNKFKRLGFIEYNGDIPLKINSSLLSVVLHD